MQNTKTGTTWAPDIRPEAIETFTETYTPEGGEEQTVTYKRVADHPILNGIRDKLAFFMTHAGAVWYNKQANRTVKDEIEDLNAKMLKYVDTTYDSLVLGSTGNRSMVAPGTRNYLFVTAITWDIGSTFSLAGTGRTFWIMGTPNENIKGLQVRYWYMG